LVLTTWQICDLLSKTQACEIPPAEEESVGGRRHRGQSVYFDIDSKKSKDSSFSKKLKPLLKSTFYRKKASLKAICSSNESMRYG